MDEYIRRNEYLIEMGFTDYRQYLRSPLWKGIRKAKLARDKECFGCAKKAAQVHHATYSWEALNGQTDKGLYSICKSCHHWIEFTREGWKRDPKHATDELYRIRKMRIGFEKRRVDRRVKMVARISRRA